MGSASRRRRPPRTPGSSCVRSGWTPSPRRRACSYDWLQDGLTLLNVFDVDISGREFKQGKPHPEIFLTAAQELGVEPAHAFVIEDAVSGIQAAKAGAFAGLGVARHDDAAMLAGVSADLVVESLDEVDLAGLSEGGLRSLHGLTTTVRA